MKDQLLLSIVIVLVMNGMASDIEVTVNRMDVADDLKSYGLVTLETSKDLKTMDNSISRAKLISSSLDDELDARVHNALKNMQKEDKSVSKARRCCCLELMSHLESFQRNS
ncbi:hypothetical protein B9Z55_007570 [Caenorhabditis nigoni]|uniref:Domain of unknown function WSN domain-containing protein n=1 Tax=Caenorhabditis nigoni TaxID=1611254 RepID=A0A2G5VA66_9PELO|nr:hypothetical protein B9Z55_007570 [Caenorhabditis nigoni]